MSATDVTVMRWAWQAAWRQQPGALLAATLAVALGVALALGIDLVNRSALHQFAAAMNTVNGAADAQISNASNRLPDGVLSDIESLPAVRVASPIIDTRVSLADDATLAASNDSGNGVTATGRPPRELQIIGLDIFRAASITPSLLSRPAQDSPSGSASPMFANDSIFLSSSALRAFNKKLGDPLPVLVNGKPVRLQIAGDLPGVPAGHAIGVMDIGTAQWRLSWDKHVSRIDVRLADGATLGQLQQQLAAHPSGTAWLVSAPDQSEQRMSNLSRAYRVNLNVLALVALFTGGFIVYASMSLATMRLTPMLAMLNVLGASRRLPAAIIVGLALLMGIVGSLLGIALGIGLASLLLTLVGGDLGGGYFDSSAAGVVIPWLPVFGFATLGLLAALAGSLAPALRLRRMAAAQTLRNGYEVNSGNGHSFTRYAIGLLLAGAALQAVPPIAGLPLASYLAIACWLIAGVALTGPVSAWLVARLSNNGSATWASPGAWLASQRVISARSSTVAALAGVVASFALVSAMAIMVHSFRVSVSDWLDTVLPADIYLRVPVSGARAGLGSAHIDAIAALTDVKRVDALRVVNLQIDASAPPLSLLARTLNPDNPQTSLPITGEILSADKRQTDCTPVYPSEPAAARLGWSPGQNIRLPITTAGGELPCFQVIAIWRDYARQNGAVVMSRAHYQALTGDNSISDLSISLETDSPPEPAMQAIRNQLSQLPGLMMRSSRDIRALSLTIFDRSFALTYALEAVALLVGLFGVATTYAGEALSRVREFGMLRHLGITRRQIARQFACEAGFSIGVGVLWGGVLGVLIAQILIHRVNPQSFHWTMQTHWPVATLLIAAAVLVALGMVTAVIAARRASGQAPIAAVRTDW